jgi:hypothetical protein
LNIESIVTVDVVWASLAVGEMGEWAIHVRVS